MTETDWHREKQLWALMRGYDPKPSDRKQRLLAVACCRRIFHVIPVEAARRCVEVAELFADSLVGPEQLGEAVWASMQDCQEAVHQRTSTGGTWGPMERAAKFAVERVHRRSESGRWATYWAASSAQAWFQILKDDALDPPTQEDDPRLVREQEREQGQQVLLLRDIFGNPLRPVAADPAWLTPTAVALAEGVYADRAFDRLPILADTLQDAGCEDADLLGHLRGDGPHVRGCWALDLVLGKE